MLQDGTEEEDQVQINRRAVLRKTATGAVGAAAFAGAASADTTERTIDSDEVIDPEEATEPDRVVEDLDNVPGIEQADCYTEYICRDERCKGQLGRVYKRECCRRGGGYICGDYRYTQNCC